MNRAEHLLELQFRIQSREGITRKYLIQLLDLIFQRTMNDLKLCTTVVRADGSIGKQEKSYCETFADCVKDAWDFARSNQFDKFVDTMQDVSRLAYERGRNSVFH